MSTTYDSVAGIGFKIDEDDLYEVERTLFDTPDDEYNHSKHSLIEYIEDPENGFPEGFEAQPFGVDSIDWRGVMLVSTVDPDDVLEGKAPYPDFTTLVTWCAEHGIVLPSHEPKLHHDVQVM